MSKLMLQYWNSCLAFADMLFLSGECVGMEGVGVGEGGETSRAVDKLKKKH